MLNKLLKNNRSYRRFKQTPAPTVENLEHLISLTRLTPSAANKQPLKFILVQKKEKVADVFACLEWAGYLEDWSGPSEEEQPTAYIIILSDPDLNEKPGIDVGLAAQTILLGAQELGFGGCLVGSIDIPRLRQALEIPVELSVQLVVALGNPDEEVRLTTVGSDGDIRYWRDKDDVHYVPKRSLEELILEKY